MFSQEEVFLIFHEMELPTPKIENFLIFYNPNLKNFSLKKFIILFPEKDTL